MTIPSRSSLVRAFFLLALVLPFFAKAQGSSSSTQVAQEPVPPVRVTTRLVQVSVVVQDRKGNPVADLTLDDFELLEDGKPQKIQAFSVERMVILPPDQPGPPNQFSNYLDSRGNRPSSLTVILLDGLNTRFNDQVYSRTQLVQFLNQLQPGDRVALYALGTRLRVLHDFTSDADVLLRALEQHRESDDAVDFFLGDSPPIIDARIKITRQAIKSIANHLARFPGRKNLVWVSGEFPRVIEPFTIEVDGTNHPPSYADELSRTTRALTAANVALYPVDARGLIAPFPTPKGINRVDPRRPVDTGRVTLENQYGPLDSMIEMAEHTGGLAFYNTNDIRRAIRRAIDDARLTYVLGYYPRHGQWNGQFHSLKVNLRRPGASARARNGYVALPEPAFERQEAEQLIDAAAWNPLDATGLRFSVGVTPFYVAGDRQIRLDITFLVADLRIRPTAGKFSGAVEYMFAQRTADGTVYVTPVERQDFQLSGTQLERVTREGLHLDRRFELKPGTTLVMVIARNPESGSIGTVRVPLDKIPENN